MRIIDEFGAIFVAHLKIHGASVLVVFLDSRFEIKSAQERSEAYAVLQASAARQGVTSSVVAVWQDLLGRTRFIAPPQQHAFLQVVRYGQLHAQINGTLTIA